MDVNSTPKIQRASFPCGRVSTTDEFSVTTLLDSSTAFRLIYSLPLLLFSIVITFAGTFLTLDRTRVFPSKKGEDDTFQYMYDEVKSTGGKKKKKKAKNENDVSFWSKLTWRLDGGLGGLLAGYIFARELWNHSSRELNQLKIIQFT